MSSGPNDILRSAASADDVLAMRPFAGSLRLTRATPPVYRNSEEIRLIVVVAMLGILLMFVGPVVQTVFGKGKPDLGLSTEVAPRPANDARSEGFDISVVRAAALPAREPERDAEPAAVAASPPDVDEPREGTDAPIAATTKVGTSGRSNLVLDPPLENPLEKRGATKRGRALPGPAAERLGEVSAPAQGGVVAASGGVERRRSSFGPGGVRGGPGGAGAPGGGSGEVAAGGTASVLARDARSGGGRGGTAANVWALASTARTISASAPDNATNVRRYSASITKAWPLKSGSFNGWTVVTSGNRSCMADARNNVLCIRRTGDSFDVAVGGPDSAKYYATVESVLRKVAAVAGGS